MEAQRAAILARIEAERKAADAWNARENSPEAKREREQIARDKRKLTAAVVELYNAAGKVLTDAGALIGQVEETARMINRHSLDKNAGGEYKRSSDVQALGVLVDTLHALRRHIAIARPDLTRNFPE